MPTQPEILARREQLEADGMKAYDVARKAYEAAVGAELRNLRETCGGIGHLFGRDRGGYSLGPAARLCVFCGAHAPLGS